MERAVIRGRYDGSSETEKIKVILTASPGSGGRQRQRANNIWNSVAEFEAEIEDFLDEELPDNAPTP